MYLCKKTHQVRYCITLKCRFRLTALPSRMAQPSTFTALMYMVAATVALAIMHGLVRHLSTTVDVYSITFFRNLFGLLAVVPLVLKNGTRSLATNRLPLHLVRGASGIFAMLLWFSALAKVESYWASKFAPAV